MPNDILISFIAILGFLALVAILLKRRVRFRVGQIEFDVSTSHEVPGKEPIAIENDNTNC